MKREHFLMKLAAAAAICLLFSGAAHAGLIEVDVPNYSFELPEIPEADLFIRVRDMNAQQLGEFAWDDFGEPGSSTIHVHRPSMPAWGEGVTLGNVTGDQVLSMWDGQGQGGGNMYITTNTDHQILKGYVYELTIDVGGRPDNSPGFAEYGLAMLVEGSDGLVEVASMNSNLDSEGNEIPSDGGELVRSASLIWTAVDEHAGQDLYLSIRNPATVNSQLWADNVRLTAIPEPGSMTMLLAGAVGLLLLRRRR